jgi:hypothetical protein
VWLACLGLLLPQTAFAAEARADSRAGHPPIRVIDVALGPQSTLAGTVVDPEGSPVADAPVVLLRGKGVAAVTETDTHGRFAFSGLQGGVYGVGAGGVVRACRAWAPRTAPPAANEGLLIVCDGHVVRGIGPMRNCQGRLYQWISEHYLLTWGFIAATIAVPIAVIGFNQRYYSSKS